jgi:hypothetical protein
MFRFVRDILLLCTVVLAILATYLWCIRTSIVEQHISSLTGLHTTVANVTVSDGRIVLHDVDIGNRPLSTLKSSLQAHRIFLTMDWSSFFSPNPTIYELTLLDPILGLDMYESGGSDNNWQEILNDLNRLGEREIGAYRIERLRLQRVQVHVCNSLLCKETLRLYPSESLIIEKRKGSQGMSNVSALRRLAKAILEESMKHPGFKNIMDDLEPERIPYHDQAPF